MVFTAIAPRFKPSDVGEKASAIQYTIKPIFASMKNHNTNTIPLIAVLHAKTSLLLGGFEVGKNKNRAIIDSAINKVNPE